MKRFIVFSMLFALVVLGTPLLIFAAKVGQPAPDFTGTGEQQPDLPPRGLIAESL